MEPGKIAEAVLRQVGGFPELAQNSAKSDEIGVSARWGHARRLSE